MASIKLKGKQILDLDGMEFPEKPDMGETLAHSLARRADGDPLKLFELALRIKEGATEIDTTDYDLIVETLKKDTQLTALAKGQIIRELRKQKGD